MFAPADFAFEAIGITNETVLTFDAEILYTVFRYHIVANEAVDNSTLAGPLREFNTLLPGSTLRNSLDGGVLDDTGAKASLLAADMQAVNGYLHAIDIVFEPYPLFTQSPTPAPTSLYDLVETLEAENADAGSTFFGEFDTLIAAISASGLDQELVLPGPYTVCVCARLWLFEVLCVTRGDFKCISTASVCVRVVMVEGVGGCFCIIKVSCVNEQVS